MRSSILLVLLSTALPADAARKPTTFTRSSCYNTLYDILYGFYRTEDNAPVVATAWGTDVPLRLAMEKEGLLYRDIAEWFDRVDGDVFKDRLLRRLFEENMGRLPAQVKLNRNQQVPRRVLARLGEKRAPLLKAWLRDFPTKWSDRRLVFSKQQLRDWAKMSDHERLNFITQTDDPFRAINLRGREYLFGATMGGDGLDVLPGAAILSFDDLRPSSKLEAQLLKVGDDLGSYEVKVDGIEDLQQFHEVRAYIEGKLGGRIGHKHVIYAWPKSKAMRAKVAAQQVEMVDASALYLFLRSMGQSSDGAAELLQHPYLGIHTRESLMRDYRAIVDGVPGRLKNKFRMVAFRSLPAGEPITRGPLKGKRALVPSIELRSGNKGAKADFMEEMIMSRLSSGDYSGLRDFRQSARFDPSAPLEELLAGKLDADEIEAVLTFQESFPAMRWSPHGRALNHLRNKIVAPLLPWAERIDIPHKLKLLERAQKRYADELLEIANWHEGMLESIRRLKGGKYNDEIAWLREATMGYLEDASYNFFRHVKLDVDFGNYLRVWPSGKLPRITVASSGPIDVNKIDFGIEYSFRFPRKLTTRKQVDETVRRAAIEFNRSMGGQGVLQEVNAGGHGHGLSVRYTLTMPDGTVWRFEQDGVQRKYLMGEEVRNSYGGHLEVPTPKFAPQTADEIERLYESQRAVGNVPSRHAGGAHVNVDLAPLRARPARDGARRAANLIKYFESNRDMIQFLWQHPLRKRVALPLPIQSDLVKHLDSFDGGWTELGRILYQDGYWNALTGRKPKYAQLNTVGLLHAEVPEGLMRDIDIKKHFEQWGLAFGEKATGRMEFRLFDAMEDEYLAALQIKYTRALLNHTINRRGRLPFERRYRKRDPKLWQIDPPSFIEAAEAHLVELGLDPEEFRPIIVQAINIRQDRLDDVQMFPSTIFKTDRPFDSD